jgi:pimeloyl-ACP methyl ester carboxylesterase
MDTLYYKQYVNSSDADWVVFVHGAGGSSAIWFKQIRAFSQHFNLLLIDLRGHGNSAIFAEKATSANYSFELIAQDIIQVLDQVKITKAHFVGVSLGTLVIRQLGDMIGDRVQSMVLVGAITYFNFKSRFWVGLGSMFKSILPYMWLYRLFAFVIMPAPTHKESRNVFVEEAKKLCRKEFLRWYKLTGQLTGLFQKFKHHLPIPTLYVMGDQDYMFLEPIKNTISNVKNAALIVVSECGHVVNIEKANYFNEQVINYLKGLNPKLRENTLTN